MRLATYKIENRPPSYFTSNTDWSTCLLKKEELFVDIDIVTLILHDLLIVYVFQIPPITVSW